MATGNINEGEALAMPAEAILALDAEGFSQLLDADGQGAKRRMKLLLAAWHPDRNQDPCAEAVMRRLLEFRRAGFSPAARTRPERDLRMADGSIRRVGVLSGHATDGGEILVTRRTVARVFTPDTVDLAEGSEALMQSLPFADQKMRQAFSPALPVLLGVFRLENGGRLQVLKRPAGSVLLSDLLVGASSSGRVFTPQEMAWVVSGLMNLASWLEWAGIVHGDISADSVFIDPQTHDVSLIGGWEFAFPRGERPKALPERTLALAPQLQVGGTADSRLVIKQIQALGRGLMGREVLPEPISRWLSWPRSGGARDSYQSWISALEKGWGPREFIHLGLTEADIYPD